MGNTTPPVLTPLPTIPPAQEPDAVGLDRHFERKAQTEMALWEASMRTAIRSDPLLASEADRLVKMTGIPLSDAEKNIDFLRGMARIKQMQDDRIEQVNPTLFRSMQNIEVARKVWDDQQLPTLERWARALEVGQLTAERGRAGAGLMAGTDVDENTKRIAEIGARLKEIGPVTGLFPSAAEIVGTQLSSVTRAAGVGLVTGTAAAGVNLTLGAVAPPAALATPFSFAGGFKVGFLSTLAVDVFQVEAGNAYASMVEAKYDPDRAFRAAVGVGLVNSALEIVGGSLATGTSGALRRAIGRDIFRRAAKEAAQDAVPGMVRSAVAEFGAPFVTGYAKAVAGETFTEVVQELVTIAGEMLAARGDDKTMTPEGVGARLWEVASKTAQGMAVLGVGGGYKSYRDSQASRLAQLKEALLAGADSPTVKRDPATAEGFVGEVLNDVPGAPKVAYIDGAILAEALAQSDKDPGDGTLRKSAEDVIEGIVPGFKEQLADAVKNGGEVELPTAKLLTSIASQLPGVADAIAEHISLKAGEPSPAMTADENKDAEQQAQQETADEEIFRAMQEAAAGQRDAVARGQSMKDALSKAGVTSEQEQGRYLQKQAERDRVEAVARVRDTIEEELSPAIREATPSVRATDVRILSRIAAETVSSLADKASVDPTAKIDPEAFFNDHRLAFAVAKMPEGAQEQPGQRGGFIPDPQDETRRRLLVILQPGTDVSTVLHELTHYYVEVLERIAAVENAPAGIRAEFDVLLNRWGYSMETWRGMDAKAREKHLEDIAYNAEDYFATGEAPSPELVPLFATIRKWLTRLYGQVRAILSSTYLRNFGAELPALTPELRSFFDRMLASKETVDLVRAQREQAALFDPAAAKKLGISPEKVAELEALDRKSVEDAQEAVAIAAVKGSKRFQAARRGAEKEAKAKLEAAQERIRAEVEEDVGGRPVYRARAFLRNGEVAGDDGTLQPAKLDTDAVREILGDEADQLRSLTRKNGTNPDAMAQQLGFPTGETMLRALLEAPPIEETIENEVNRRLEAEEPLADPAEFRRTVEGALRGKAATRLASELIRALLNNSRTTAQIEASAKQAARIVLLRTHVGQISTKRYALNELRAGKAAREALKAGKVAEALEAMRKYLLQHYLTKQSIDIEKEVAAFTNKVRNTYQKPDPEIIKAKRNLDVVQAMRVLLARHGAMGKIPAANAEAHMKTLAERNRDEHARLVAQINNASPEPKPWRELSLEQWRVVEDAASQMWHESKRGEQFRVAGELVQRSEVRAKLESKLVDTFGGDKKPDVAFFGALVSILSSMTRLEAWALRADGGEVGGPWQVYVHRVLEAAQTAKDAETVKHRAWFKGWLQAFGDLGGGKIDASKWLGPGVVFKNRGHLLGAIMAMGTDSNFRNMVLGERWAEQVNGELVTLDGAPFAPRWMEFLGAMADAGKLRKSDFDNAQAGINYVAENFKGRVFDTTREVWGFYPKEVEAQAFDTPFGRYPGGYFPSKVDLDRADLGDRSKLDAIAQGKENFIAANTNVPRGQTITRQENAVQPRNLDIGVMWDHIDEALSIIHLQPALTDVAGVLRSQSLRTTLKHADPNAMRNVILPAMNRLVRQSIMAPSNKHLRAIVNWAKQNVSLAFLGFSPRNAAQQITGISNGVVYSSVGGILSVLRRGVFNPFSVIRPVKEASGFMQSRWSTEMQQMSQDIEQLVNPSKIGKAQAKLREAAFFGQRVAQMFTDAVVWQAAFDKANVDLKGMDPTALKAEAVERADQAVRMSQGNKSPLDVPEILAGPALAQLFTQFGDYPNTVLNQNIAAPTGRRFATVMYTLVIPTLMASSIALAFAGFRIGKGSRADDDDAEDIVAHLLGAQVKGAFAMIPGLGGAGGSIANALIDRLGATLFGEGLPKLAGEQFLRNSPFAADALVGAIQNMADGDASPRDTAMFWSMVTGFPAQVFGNPANYLRRMERGQAQPSSSLDYVRGLINGR